MGSGAEFDILLELSRAPDVMLVDIAAPLEGDGEVEAASLNESELELAAARV